MANRLVLGLAVAVVVVAASLVHAAVDEDLKCKEAKVKAAGLEAFTLMKAFGTNKKKPNPEKLDQDVAKARSKFTKLFTTPETKAWCTTTGDAPTVELAVDGCVEDLISIIAPPVTTSTTTTPGSTTSTTTTTLSVCGDGSVSGNEQCDPPDFDGATCETLGFNLNPDGTLGCTEACQYDVSGCECQAIPATGQTTCWNSAGALVPCSGTGHDGNIKAGTPLAYMDNGDGTITDLNTGLMWEKKSDDSTIHDKDTLYTWDQAFTTHVAGLNGANFAGHSDWRVPNYKELISILDLEMNTPAVDTAFNTGCAGGCSVGTCSCTITGSNIYYWSSTSLASSPAFAWAVNFTTGDPAGRTKTLTHHVRAVRGGL